MSDPEKHTRPRPLEVQKPEAVDDERLDQVTEAGAPALDEKVHEGLEIEPERTVEGVDDAPREFELEVEPKTDQTTTSDPDEPESLIDAEWLGAQFAQFSAAVESMVSRFEVVSAQSKRVHEINGELHSQLQSIRANALLEMMRPGFGGFVRLIGQLDNDIERLQTSDDPMANILVAYRTSLANALQDCGLSEDPATPLEVSAEFAPSRQEINAIVPTDDPDKDRKISRVALPGFSFGDSRLFREKVDVYRYVEPAQQGEQE